MRRFWSIASFLVFLPVSAMAQHHGGAMAAPAMRVAPVSPQRMAPMGRIVTGAPRTGTRVGTTVRGGTAIAGARNVRGSRGGVRINPNLNTPVFPNEFARENGFTFNDVPGLGFDFPHMAAVSGNRRARFGFGEGFGSSFGFDGFLLSPPVIVEGGQPAEQGPTDQGLASSDETDSQRVPRSERGDASSSYSSAYAPATSAPASASPAAAPLKDSEEYVFVRRDGGIVFAVAYSWDRGNLRYVTADGVRKSISRDTLDLDATQQFNEQRGLNFHSPA
jgi:hypothetical protein